MSDVFLDTNVLVYAFDVDSPEKRQRAIDVMSEHPDAAISTQVMLEWFSVVTSKLSTPLSADAAIAGLTALAQFDVVGADADLVVKAARTAAEHQLSLWDAAILEAAALAGARRLLTEDMADGRTIRGIQISNPFTTP